MSGAPIQPLYLAACPPAAEHSERGHPEQPARIDAALAGIDDLHLDGALVAVAPRPAGDRELARAHSPAYLRTLAARCAAGGGALDPDTYLTPHSLTAARLVSGAGLAVIEALGGAASGVGLVVGRPPGHHATAGAGMGFCLVNHVAVAAATLAEAGERVLVVDWDVHHGNGTQDIFWDDRRVLYLSAHQAPLYPGTGAAGEVGGPKARGLTWNVPVPAGATGDVVLAALESAAGAVAAFSPTWVLVSAGFDAHRDDPLAGLALSDGDFAALADCVARWAPRPARLIGFLEGGYALGALRASMRSVAGRWVGLPVETAPRTTGGADVAVVVEAAAARRDAPERACGATHWSAPEARRTGARLWRDALERACGLQPA